MAFVLWTDYWLRNISPDDPPGDLAQAYRVSPQVIINGIREIETYDHQVIKNRVSSFIQSNLSHKRSNEPEFFLKHILAPYLDFRSVRITPNLDEQEIYSKFFQLFTPNAPTNVFQEELQEMIRILQEDNVYAAFPFPETNLLLKPHGYKILLMDHRYSIYRIQERIPIDVQQYSGQGRVSDFLIVSPLHLLFRTGAIAFSLMDDEDLYYYDDSLRQKLTIIANVVDPAGAFDYHYHVRWFSRREIQERLRNLNIPLTPDKAANIVLAFFRKDFSNDSQEARSRKSLKSSAIHEVKHRWEEREGVHPIDREFSAYSTEVIFGETSYSSLYGFIDRMNLLYSKALEEGESIETLQKFEHIIRQLWLLAIDVYEGKADLNQQMKERYMNYQPVTPGYRLPPLESFEPVASKINEIFDNQDYTTIRNDPVQMAL